jgi:hypothetical protein
MQISSFEMVSRSCGRPRLSEDDTRMVEILQRPIRHNGQVIALLWKSDDLYLPDNRSAALRQLQHLERQFVKDPIFTSNETGSPGRVWYLPHHVVTSVDKHNKVRGVLNCSTKLKGVSLNPCLFILEGKSSKCHPLIQLDPIGFVNESSWCPLEIQTTACSSCRGYFWNVSSS